MIMRSAFSRVSPHNRIFPHFPAFLAFSFLAYFPIIADRIISPAPSAATRPPVGMALGLAVACGVPLYPTLPTWVQGLA